MAQKALYGVGDDYSDPLFAGPPGRQVLQRDVRIAVASMKSPAQHSPRFPDPTILMPLLRCKLERRPGPKQASATIAGGSRATPPPFPTGSSAYRQIVVESADPGR